MPLTSRLDVPSCVDLEATAGETGIRRRMRATWVGLVLQPDSEQVTASEQVRARDRK